MSFLVGVVMEICHLLVKLHHHQISHGASCPINKLLHKPNSHGVRCSSSMSGSCLLTHVVLEMLLIALCFKREKQERQGKGVCEGRGCVLWGVVFWLFSVQQADDLSLYLQQILGFEGC